MDDRIGRPQAPSAAAGAGDGEAADGTGSRGFALPRVLSPSRAGDFLTCPLLFRFRVVDRIPERPRAEMVRGSLVHSVLERIFDLPSGRRTPQQAADLLPAAWEEMLAREPGLGVVVPGADDAEGGQASLTAWLEGARALLSRYFTLEDPNRLEPAERELRVETTLPSGLRLRGYVDRLDVSPAGDMRIVDYKTGRAPGPAFEGKALFQMKFYALVLWRLRGRVPRRLQLIYLGSGEVVTLDPDESDLRAAERKIDAVWEAIDKAARSASWRPSPGKLCGWCDHQAICPAFGGTPPPLPAAPPAAVRVPVQPRSAGAG